LAKYHKGAYYTGIEIFNYLPTHIKEVANEIQVFKKILKRFLLDNLFYSIDRYNNNNFNCKWAVTWWQRLLCMYVNMK